MSGAVRAQSSRILLEQIHALSPVFAVPTLWCFLSDLFSKGSDTIVVLDLGSGGTFHNQELLSSPDREQAQRLLARALER